jgi:hypothetical protein
MSEEVTSTPIAAESQIDLHVRENYEGLRIDRGLTWDQMADQFDKDRNGELLAAWAKERSGASFRGELPAGIESRGELPQGSQNTDAPKKLSKRGNAKDLDPSAE